MKYIVKLVRLSSKEAFLKLRDVGKIYCHALDRNFVVTNLFLRHISGNATKRSIQEVISRLSSITLVEKIAQTGKLVETRKNVIVEGKRNFVKTFKIQAMIKDFEFFLVLGQKKDGKIILISIFLNHLK